MPNNILSGHPRFYCPSLRPGCIDLPDSEAHHALHVMRLRDGAAVELFDGVGGVAVGTVTAAGRKSVTCEVGEVVRRSASRPRVQLAFAVPKGKRIDWLLEKCTELGAAVLQPVVFERSVAGGDSLSDSKRDRWLGHCISAAKQCGLNHLPDIRDALPLADLLTHPPTGLLLLGDGGTDSTPIASAAEEISHADAVTLLVGPEGGLTEEERDAAVAAGFLPVRLGETILRIETAAVALLAAVQAMGDRS